MAPPMVNFTLAWKTPGGRKRRAHHGAICSEIARASLSVTKPPCDTLAHRGWRCRRLRNRLKRSALRRRWFPVPLWSSQGTGLLLPTVPVAATDGQVTGPVLTITLAELQTGEAPSAMLRKGVITLHGDYPGAVLADDAVIQPANAPPPTLVAPIGLLASRFANVAGHLPDATLAVFVDAGLANWPVAMKLRSRWRTLAANEGNALQINVADGTWQLDPRSPPVPIPAATSITARVAALRAAHPEFGQAAVVLRYGASSTVGDLVDWVVALAPTQWTAEAAPTK